MVPGTQAKDASVSARIKALAHGVIHVCIDSHPKHQSLACAFPRSASEMLSRKSQRQKSWIAPSIPIMVDPISTELEDPGFTRLFGSTLINDFFSTAIGWAEASFWGRENLHWPQTIPTKANQLHLSKKIMSMGIVNGGHIVNIDLFSLPDKELRLSSFHSFSPGGNRVLL